MTINICARCKKLKSQTSPMTDTRLNHGLCRYCFLLSLAEAGIAKTEELAELSVMRDEMVTIMVTVAPHVAAAIETERQLARLYKEYSEVAGQILTREVNRAEWEKLISTQTVSNVTGE